LRRLPQGRQRGAGFGSSACSWVFFLIRPEGGEFFVSPDAAEAAIGADGAAGDFGFVHGELIFRGQKGALRVENVKGGVEAFLEAQAREYERMQAEMKSKRGAGK
jgi:hypothetical protein